MNAKEFVQIVKKMFSKGLTPEEKIKLADEGPVCRLLLRQWDIRGEKRCVSKFGRSENI